MPNFTLSLPVAPTSGRVLRSEYPCALDVDSLHTPAGAERVLDPPTQSESLSGAAVSVLAQPARVPFSTGVSQPQVEQLLLPSRARRSATGGAAAGILSATSGLAVFRKRA